MGTRVLNAHHCDRGLRPASDFAHESSAAHLTPSSLLLSVDGRASRTSRPRMCVSMVSFGTPKRKLPGRVNPGDLPALTAQPEAGAAQDAGRRGDRNPCAAGKARSGLPPSRAAAEMLGCEQVLNISEWLHPENLRSHDGFMGVNPLPRPVPPWKLNTAISEAHCPRHPSNSPEVFT
jgi:hypothetical protein